MTYIPDLTPCTYHRKPTENIAIGWLDIQHLFPTGDTSQEFKDKLKVLVDTRSVNRYMGWYSCQWCPHIHPLAAGNGSIVVESPITKIVYEAPVLIYHYVTEHSYFPPLDFITAVLYTPTME